MRQGLSPQRIPVAGPWITDREIAYVADAAANAWYDRAGMYNDRFEAAFAAFVGVQRAMSLPSCTSALHLALLALGVGPGDEVIVPDLTWIASAAPITYVGATPVFADIDPETWCLSAATLKACVTPRSKAVIPVDLYGVMPDYDGIRDVARRHGLAVVEDAAEAFGATFAGRQAGSLGDVGVFSFHGSKTLTTGEGGMLVTNDEVLHDRVQFLRDHGRKPGDVMFFNAEVAWKYKMSSLQAAFGLAQVERADMLVRRKREIFGWYRDRLEGVPGLCLNPEPAGTQGVFWMVTVLLDPSLGWTKEGLLAAMDARGIACRPFFHPLSSIPAFAQTHQAGLARQRNTAAYAISPRGINLPSGFNMTEALVDRVCQTLLEILSNRPSRP